VRARGGTDAWRERGEREGVRASEQEVGDTGRRRAWVGSALACAVLALGDAVPPPAWAGPVEDMQARRAQPSSVQEALKNVLEDNVELNKERAEKDALGLFEDEVREDTKRVVLEDDLIAGNIVGDLFTLFRWQLAAILFVTGISGIFLAKKKQDDGEDQ